jgi:hypothetical protein
VMATGLAPVKAVPPASVPVQHAGIRGVTACLADHSCPCAET